jgi:hypothetical protein
MTDTAGEVPSVTDRARAVPNHALGQDNDWINEPYPRFVMAHGLMLITPVH